MALSIEERMFLRRLRQEKLRQGIESQKGFLKTLQRVFDDADAALQAAHGAVAAAQSWRDVVLEDVISFESQLAARLEELEHYPTIFDDELIRTLPVEILRMIFTEVFLSHVPPLVDIAEEKYDFERAVAPFRLAAVCGRWRHVALGTARLWTYVALPSRARRSSAEPLKSMIASLLKHSKTQPLEVFFHCDTNTVATWMWPLLVPVCAEFPRWKRGKLVLPTNSDLPSLTFLSMFPSTSLSAFHLDWVDSFPEALPDLPMLSSSDTLRSFNIYALFIHPRSIFGSLLSTTLFVDHVCAKAVANMLRGMPHLQALTLTSRTGLPEESTVAVSGTIHLPKLTLLEFSGCSATLLDVLRQLSVPSVTHLILGAAVSDSLDTWLPLLRERLPDVTWARFSADSPEQLWTADDILDIAYNAFRKLRRVELSRCLFSKHDCSGSDVYSRWTELESVMLCGCESYTADEYLRICDFLAQLESGLYVPDLELIVVGLKPVPEWLPLALARAVGRKKCHIFDETGAELPMPRHDYAEFTDPDEDDTTDSEDEASDGEGDDDGYKNEHEDSEKEDSDDDHQETEEDENEEFEKDEVEEGDDEAREDDDNDHSPDDAGSSSDSGPDASEEWEDEESVGSDDMWANGPPWSSDDAEDEDFEVDTRD